MSAKPKEQLAPDFTGITASSCPAACTKKRCVISTSKYCKHPMKAPISGCGPITRANREAAMKILKIQQIDKG